MNIEVRQNGDQPNWYSSGIIRAEAEGRIHQLDECAFSLANEKDEFRHLIAADPDILLLKATNLRKLSASIKKLVVEQSDYLRLHILELGPGAGFAASYLRELAPSAFLTTISLNPINPYLEFQQHFTLKNLLQQNKRIEDFHTVFCETATPIIDKQIIAEFSVDHLSDQGPANLIYDSYGPLSNQIKLLYDPGNQQYVVEFFRKLMSALPPGGKICMDLPLFFVQKLQMIQYLIGAQFFTYCENRSDCSVVLSV